MSYWYYGYKFGCQGLVMEVWMAKCRLLLKERERQGEKLESKGISGSWMLNSSEMSRSRGLLLVLRGSLATLKRILSIELGVGPRRKSPVWGKDNERERQRSPASVTLLLRLELPCAGKMTIPVCPGRYYFSTESLHPRTLLSSGPTGIVGPPTTLMWHLALSRFSVFAEWMKKMFMAAQSLQDLVS